MPAVNTPTRAEALARLTAPGEPYELRTVEISGRPHRAFANAPASLRDLFEQTASDAEFLVYADERLTFAQAHATARRIAHLLVTEHGVRPGDRVAIALRNYPEWVLAFTAVTSIGAVAVAMNALWQPDELVYGLDNSGATVLFADAERLDRLTRGAPRPDVAVIPVRTDRADDLARRLAAVGDVAMPPATIAPDDPATIFYTSGSTGHPKGVLSTHRAVLSALWSWELDAAAYALVTGAAPPEPGPDQPAALLAVPLFHVTGSHAVYLMSYRAQRKLVCMYKWDAEHAAELIERERVNSVVAPAAMTGDLVRVARTTSRDLGSLRVVGGGGAPRAPEQVRQIDATIASAVPNTGWGMTETNAIGAGIVGQDYLDHPASSGRCPSVMELRIVDDAGAALPAGQRGELQVRGTAMFREYWERPDVNAEVFAEEGWFRTGDVAVLDDEGYLYIVDRIKDLIIRGGENIGCGVVENALLMHPGVLEASVYAVPDERLGEEVGATVHGGPGLDVDELRGFLERHLARFEVPRYLKLTTEPLPRTASGKILKRDLRDEAVRSLGLH